MRKKILIYILLSVQFSNLLFGNSLPEIKLRNVDGLEFTNSNLSKSEFVCIILYSNHCRVSQKFEFAIKEIDKELRDENSTLIVVSPNNEKAIIPDELAYSDLSDGVEDMKKRYLQKEFSFPFLYDGEYQTISKSLEASTTPQAFLFNQKRELIYNGKIGDYNEPENLEKSDLLRIYHDALKGKSNFLKTKVHGSSIKSSNMIEIANNIKRKYSQEKVTIRKIQKSTLEFFLEYGTKRPTIFYLWTTTDENSRENLLSLSEIFKIFRKRGFKLYTLCVGGTAEKALINLKHAQLSSMNFHISGEDIVPLTRYIPVNSRKLTPMTVFFGSNKNFKKSVIGKINKQELKKILVEELN